MKQMVEVDLKWYCYEQNNSGGRFIVDDKVAEYVFVQERSAEEANTKAEEITAQSSYDWCPCCGERWYINASPADGYDVPSIYGESIFDLGEDMFRKEARLHYWDGRVEEFFFKKTGEQNV